MAPVGEIWESRKRTECQRVEFENVLISVMIPGAPYCLALQDYGL
jgi:hypothetical protein